MFSFAAASLTWLDLASFTLAVLAFATSAVLGLLNRRTARRALAISERQEERQESRIDLYFIDSQVRRRGAQDRIVALEVRISNPSDRPNTLVDAELRVTYSVGDAPMTVKLRPDLSDEALLEEAGACRLDLPVAIEANGACSGWISFRVDDQLTALGPIDRYEFVVHDVHGAEQGLPVTVLKRTET